jgi:hypothetical protein
MIMLEYDKAKALLIHCLLRDAGYHEAGDFEKLGNDFDRIDGGLPRYETESLKLLIAFDFWDGWIDASNHDWRYYDPIEVEDWPVLARRIVADLEADQAISDSVVLERFGQRFGRRKSPTLQRMIAALVRRVGYLIGTEKMDREEAKAILTQNLSPYKRWSFNELQNLVGQENVVEVDGASGTKYNFEIYVAPVNEIEDSLLVEGYVTKTNERRWTAAVEHAEFGMSPNGRIYYQSTKLDGTGST